MTWTPAQWQAAIAELERQRDILASRAVSLAAEGQRLQALCEEQAREIAELRQQVSEA